MRNVPCAGSFIRPKDLHKTIFRVVECGPRGLVAIAVHPDGKPMAGDVPWAFRYGNVKDISHEVGKV